jgi:hypothetical protein
MKPLTLALLLLLTAGCAAPATEPALPMTSIQATAPEVGPWTVGDWWDVRFYMDLGPGYREEGSGRVVVASATENEYRLLATDRSLATFDAYFDLFFIGPFTPLRQPIVEGQAVVLLPANLTPGARWKTDIPVPVFGQDRLIPSNANLTSSVFDPENNDGRLRIAGTTENGFHLDLDYNPSHRWFSYLRLVEDATGRIVLAVDIDASGSRYQGPLHEVLATPIFERLTVTPPCTSSSNCDPAFANVPPVLVAQSSSHAFAETIAYLFAFPVAPVGGATVDFVFTDPTNTPTRRSHASISDRFEGTFSRTPFDGDPAGTWTFQYHIVGTGGAYTAVFGLDETVTTL